MVRKNGIEEEKIALSYQTISGQASEVGFVGPWSGVISQTSEEFTDLPFAVLTIELHGQNQFKVVPDQVSFTFRGDPYSLSHDESEQVLEFASDNKTSHFSLFYRAPGLKRIVFHGFFVSKSEMAGTFWFNGRRRSHSVGLLSFKK